MGKAFSIGLDFGTSNTVLGVTDGSTVDLLLNGDGQATVPSAIFYDTELSRYFWGEDAERKFFEGAEGRYLRALKSILGTSLEGEKTRLGDTSVAFTTVLEYYLRCLKQAAEERYQTEITRVVAGRPVHFIDNDATRDAAAQITLESVLRAIGFKEIIFQLEPVAAHLGAGVETGEGTFSVVADIGGGTSDFTLVSHYTSKGKYRQDVLCTGGVHVGGTDLDRLMSIAMVAPELGYGSLMRSPVTREVLPLPKKPFLDLATWEKIHFSYTSRNRAQVRELARHALEKEKVARLRHIIEMELGHDIAAQVEKAKIRLSTDEHTTIEIPSSLALPPIPVGQHTFYDQIEDPLHRISQAIGDVLLEAGVKPGQVSTLILSGGPTLSTVISETISNCVPDATVLRPNPFSCVAKGLTRQAMDTFYN